MLLQQFKDFIKDNLGLNAHQHILLLAVSGGVDSIVLTHLCHACGFQFIIAHCNFQLRGMESELDEAFVLQLEKQYNVKVCVKKFDTVFFAAQQKLTIQEAARQLRYEWFEELRQQYRDEHIQHIHFIATAHHANDNIETVLLNFFRGTGIAGLHGILPKQHALIRPLLFASRSTIEEYAKQQGLVWREDTSNATEKYTRNFIRLQVLPSLKKVFPQIENNMLANIARFSEVEQLYNEAVSHYKKKLLKQYNEQEWHISILELKKAPALHTLIWEIFSAFAFSTAQVNEIIKLMDAANGSYITSSTHRVIKNRRWLIITSAQPLPEFYFTLVEQKDKKIQFFKRHLWFEWLEKEKDKLSISTLKGNAHTAYLDAAHIRLPLIVRKWQQGDYFYPLGLGKKKKISKLLIDLKLSPTEKEKVYVAESNKKILWVIGIQIDERFKITNSTREVLKITLR